MKISAESSNQLNVLTDPDCFSYLLRFYDGLCSWEEDSSTPVLHIGWTKPLVTTISKFDSHVRSIVDIEIPNKTDGDSDALNQGDADRSSRVKIPNTASKDGKKEETSHKDRKKIQNASKISSKGNISLSNGSAKQQASGEKTNDNQDLTSNG